MANHVQYNINISIEVTILFFLAILLVTLFWQKNLFSTTIPLIFLTSFIILTLINQIVTWTLLSHNVLATYGAMPMRIVYTLDYIFYYSVSVSIYFYVETLVKDEYKHIGATYQPPRYIYTMLFAWGIISSLLYAVLLFVPSLYRVENGEDIFSIPAYICAHIAVKFACACAIALILRHRSVIGKPEAILSLCFILLICTFVVIDELCGLCISYILTSVFTFILYVRIDLHKGLLIERKEKEIIEWKTQIMLSQMQPHFLYNVLTTISSMCEMQNATQARDVVNHFADYLRINLDSLSHDRTIPFEKELEHVKTYLWLEKIRFEDLLNIQYEIGTTNFEVPSLTIQPMVENAVKHGILPKEDAGTLTLRTYETEQDYVIIIEDDGVGFDVNHPLDTRKHVGIENVKKRLDAISSGTCTIQSELNKGTVVSIHIPKGDFS